jgi:SulP family sulfate permease
MNGIAVLIWKDQLLKVLHLKEGVNMEGGPVLNTLIALVTFITIFVLAALFKKLPLRPQIRSLLSAVLWSIILMTVIISVLNVSLERVELGSSVGTLSEYFNSIKNYFPASIFTVEYFLLALPYAGQLMLLAYLDSLLTALVIDRMTKEKSNLNKELWAQGLANGVAGALQAIPGAQATIRSVLLLKEGAQTRLAGVLIGVFALMSLLIFKDYLTLVPAAVFAGVLLKAGLDVSDKDFPSYYFRYKWFESRNRNIQMAFIVYTTIVTVLVDLNVAVITGTILFYIAQWKFKMQDVEPDLQLVSEQEEKLITR